MFELVVAVASSLVVATLSAGLLYVLFGTIPLAIAVFSWHHRVKPGATPLAYAGVCATAATVIQGFRFIEPLVETVPWAGIVLHIGLLVAINLAVLGTLYIAVEYTGQRWLLNVWFVLVLAALATLLPTARILAETTETAPAGAIADADFVYRLVLAVAALSLFARQFLSVRGVYRKQSGALFAGLAVGFLFGLLERFYSVQFVEFTLIGMTLGYVVIVWALFRYELLEAVPIARETLFDQVTDPVVALDSDRRVVDLNSAAYETFGVTDAIIGSHSSDLFRVDETLASRYEELLDGAKPVAAIVSDGKRHFVADHPVVLALREGQSLRETDSEVGIHRDGTVRYFQVTVTTLELAPQYDGQLVVFRDVTRSTEREQDLDILKQVLTRVLRHNLRNDVNAIQGYAGAIANQTDDQTRDMAQRIIRMTNDLTETSETARRIEDVIDAETPIEFNLTTIVERVLADVREEYPEAVIECDVPPGMIVLANPELPAAVTEVVENAVTHVEGDAHVRITGKRSERRVSLTVADSGPGIPKHELETLRQGKETPLVHGSGAGLWLVQLVVQDSNGDVSYDTTPDGTTVRIRLPVPEEAQT